MSLLMSFNMNNVSFRYKLLAQFSPGIVFLHPGLEKRVVELIKLRGGITTLVPNWNNYNYDVGTTSNHISDGGSDMFDTGNKVNVFEFCIP